MKNTKIKKQKSFEKLSEKWSNDFRHEYKLKHNITQIDFKVEMSDAFKDEKNFYLEQKRKEYANTKENKRFKMILENVSNEINETKIDKYIEQTLTELRQNLKNCGLYYQRVKITMDNIVDYLREIEEIPEVFLKNASFKKVNLMDFCFKHFKKLVNEEFKNMRQNVNYYIDDDGNKVNARQTCKDEWLKKLETRIFEKFDSNTIIRLIEQNKSYKNFRAENKRKETILREIPENFIDLYPKARMMNRHFVLHIGDTNSGKTYESLEKLKEVNSGVYLAPLRLLALEVQEKMLESNVMCSLSTGEEEDLIPNSTHLHESN